MNTTEQQKRDSIHESGHALIAKLFEEDFLIESITLDPDLYASKTNTEDWRGGIHIKPRKYSKKIPSIEHKDKLIIIMWGGFVAFNVFTKGSSEIRKNLSQYIDHPDLLNQEGFYGDRKKTQPYILEQTKCRGISNLEYRRGFLRFAFNYILQDKVWRTIESLSELVLSKPNLTVTKKEIEEHYREVGFSKYLYKNKSSFLGTRFKVKMVQKLIYYFKYRCL